MFARLLTSAFRDDYADLDEYEEFVSILDDLSHREIRLLVMLRDVERTTAQLTAEGKSIMPAGRWEVFAQRAEEEMGIPRNEVSAVLTRAARSGCVRELTGTMLGYAGGQFEVTQSHHFSIA